MRRPFFHGLIIAIVVATAIYATFLPSRSTSRASSFIGGNESQSALADLPSSIGVTVQNQSSSGSKNSSSYSETAGQVSNSSSSPSTDSTSTSNQTAATPTPDDKTRTNATGAGTATPGPGTPTATPSSASTATTTPTPEACEPGNALYCVYTVVEGDTLSGLATRFGLKGNDAVTAWEMLAASNKPDVVNEDELELGQKLRIPVQSGILHTVLSAQTLTDIAEQYEVTSDEIIAVGANNIADPNNLAIGQELLIPNPTRFRTPVQELVNTLPNLPGGDSSSEGGSSTPPLNIGPRSSAGFMWPASGPISSYFGPSHPLGIDIDFFSNPNQSVVAVAGGTVTFAGGDACCSYGYYVIVDHGNGLQTLYAHFSSISVSVGQKVAQGQQLGRGGRTGYATGNHLHFEVHVNGIYVNPMQYLP